MEGERDRPPPPGSMAAAIRAGEEGAVARAASALLRLRPDNLVERPWGGDRLLPHKGLLPGAPGPRRLGEAFEVAADPSDEETRDHPSVVVLPDESEIDLPALLAAGGERVLGPAFLAAFGARIPLLPKTIDVAELLSVQVHPAGLPEAYVILDADEGATIRLGFRAEANASAWRARLVAGRAAQEALLPLLREDVPAADLQGALAPGLAARRSTPADLGARILPLLASTADRERATRHLATLHATYWEVLDGLNEIPVRGGDVIFNASAESVRAAHPSPEAHALGSPEGTRILLFEVRRPGVTLRLWDHGRFPLRPLAIDEAIAAMSTRATSGDDFRVARRAVDGRPGVYRSVVCPFFVVVHLQPPPDAAVVVPPDVRVRTLHTVRGAAEIRVPSAARPEGLRRGASALVPAGVGPLEVRPVEAPLELLLIEIPTPGVG